MISIHGLSFHCASNKRTYICILPWKKNQKILLSPKFFTKFFYFLASSQITNMSSTETKDNGSTPRNMYLHRHRNREGRMAIAHPYAVTLKKKLT